MAAEFLASFEKIKTKHNEAFRVIDQAVRSEEQENPAEALGNYKKGIQLIDEALATPVGLPEDADNIKAEWREACKIVHKLKRARAEVLQRIGMLTTENRSNEEANPEVLRESGGRPRTYSELAQALRNLQSEEPIADTLQLIFACDGVRLYHIKANGVVTTTSDHSTLRVLRLDGDEQNGLYATCFLQIIKTTHTVPLIRNIEEDDFEIVQPLTPTPSTSTSNYSNADNFDAKNDSSWIYPLIPGVSPCFRTEFGAFIFPYLESPEPGVSFGLILPKEENLDDLLLEILEAILHGVVIQLEDGHRVSPRSVPVKVSENIIRGANFVSTNLVRGAEKAGQFISYSTPYLISKIRSAPSDTPPVSSNVKSSVEVAKNVTGVAATCAGYLTRAIADKTNSLGKFLAPHIQRHGSTFLTKAFGIDETSANEKMTAALTVAASAVEGFGTIYSGLEESAKILGSNLSNNSVKIIEHRYGMSAGSLASETFDTVGNVINLSRNVSIVKPQSFLKSAAKGTGKAVIRELNPIQCRDPNVVPASSLYPDLSGLNDAISK